MKDVYLLRHAKSSWADPDQRDFDRPLNARGRDAADLMGRWCRANGLAPDQLLVSAARRTQETAVRLKDAWGLAPPTTVVDALYLATTDTLLATLQALPETTHSVMIVGHNPGLEDLAMLLAGDGDPEHLATLAEKYPTGTLAHLSFDIRHWSELAPRGGWLEHFVRPRQLDASHDDD